jgi:hypothetical protein
VYLVLDRAIRHIAEDNCGVRDRQGVADRATQIGRCPARLPGCIHRAGTELAAGQLEQQMCTIDSCVGKERKQL